MANRYWVGGTSTWDGTAGTKWALTSGGAGGAAVPTSADDVFFDAASGTNTVTIASGNTGAKSINCTGFTGTLAGSTAITVAGSITYSATMTLTYNSTMTISGTGTFTTAGKTINHPIVINTSGITVTLGDTFYGTNTFTLSQGTFTTASYNFRVSSFVSTGTSIRALNLGSSTFTISSNTGLALDSTNFTFNSGTSTIDFVSASPALTLSGGFIFYNVSFTSTASTATPISIGTSNTFNNLTFTGSSITGSTREVTFAAPQTINGTLSTTGTAGNRRVWFRGATYGLAQTLTVNAAPSLTDADFRDIIVQGIVAPIGGTRIGNLGGCQGITFSTPKTVYWNNTAGSNWLANNFAASSGGAVSPDNFPLPQDTTVIGNTGLGTSATITLDTVTFHIGSIDMSTRTNAMTFSVGSGIPIIYGNWINGSGTTISGSATLTFSGRNTQTITSAGKTLTCSITVDSYGGTVELADALNIPGRTLTVTNGTFDTKNYNVTASALSSSNSNVRAITLGSSTVTLSSASAAVSISTSTNLTFNYGTSTLVLTNTSSSTPLDVRGVSQLYDVSFTNTAAYTCNINGAPTTIRNLSFTAPASAGITNINVGANFTITGTLTVAGASPIRRVFVRSDTLGTTRTLTVGTLSATDCDFRDITIAGTAAGSSPTRAGNCGGNSGITFPAAKTVYWNLAGVQGWSATGWAPGSGGTPDINNFPLAQDTAVFDNTGAAGTITIDAAWNIGTFDASARTTAMTLTEFVNAPFVYGDWKFGTGVTHGAGSGITFSKRGTQTITSNGITFNSQITVDSITGTLQLADALLMGSIRQLNLVSGTFDAVSYNVTLGKLSAALNGVKTLKMGSGTWTLLDTGTVWDFTGSNTTFYKSTANIVLSDTSTSARTFNGGGLSYNKLTIGGTTGTSTLTITGNNQFTELASTKTVAHTIALGTTTQTFGKWTVTGTVGNVVTLTGTGTSHILAGACTSGIDYLAMGSIGFASTSPGEFYAGANSTGTAGAPVYRTAKPADSTRYWVGGTGNWSDTARWSTSSGGASGASVPRSHDDVVFDAASSATAYTATVDAVTGGIRMKSLTIAGPASGNVTLAGTTAMVGIHGNVTLPATGLTRTYTGAITLSGSTTGRTFTTNGVTLANAITVNGVDCEWTLGSALNIGSNTLTLTNGTFRTSTFNLTANSISSDNINTRTYDFGSGTTTLSGTISFGDLLTTGVNLTVVPGTSQITFTSSGASRFNGHTYNNVTFAWTTVGQTVQIHGNNTFNNLTIAGATGNGFKTLQLYANQTVTGTLTFSSGTNASMRNFCNSYLSGTQMTITAASVSMTDVDFQNTVIAGAASPASGTRIGNCGNNSGITFTPAANKYYSTTGATINWTGAGWSLTEVGAASIDNFPLPQDTVIFTNLTGPNTGGMMILVPTYNYGTIDFSQRTNAMTFNPQTNIAVNIHGNLILGPGLIWTGGNGSLILFRGFGTQNITSSGKTISNSTVNISPLGSVVLNDSLTVTQAINFIQGTLNLNGYNITGTSFNTAYSTSRTLLMNNGTLTLGSSSTVWDASTSTNLTVTGPGTISLTSATAKTFNGGSIAYTDITLDQSGAGTLTISGNNTFKSITNSYNSTGTTTINLGTTTQRVSKMDLPLTNPTNRLTITGTSSSSPATLIYTGTGIATDINSLNITGVKFYPLIDAWYVGKNSTSSGSLGAILNTTSLPENTKFLLFIDA